MGFGVLFCFDGFMLASYAWLCCWLKTLLGQFYDKGITGQELRFDLGYDIHFPVDDVKNAICLVGQALVVRYHHKCYSLL